MPRDDMGLVVRTIEGFPDLEDMVGRVFEASVRRWGTYYSMRGC